jgi:hypothetical protein
MYDKPRLLAPQARRGDGLGYVDHIAQAMRDEPEALSVNDWKRHVERRSELTDKQRRTVEEIARDRTKRLLSQEERIVKAHREAQAKRRDVSREMWMLRNMQAGKCKPDALEKKVQELERIVYLGRAA